jgi:hypothetical protein
MSDQRTYIKHFVECNCILQIFKHLPSPPFHQFPVFSELEGAQQKFVSHFAICPNCNAVHKVLEVGHSKIQRKETVPALKTKEDISANLPDKVAAVLEKNECDITVYQEVEFVFQHQLWGKPVVIYKEIQDGETVGKSITLLGESLVKVDNFSFSNTIDLNEDEE